MTELKISVSDMDRLEIWDWIFDNTRSDVRILTDKESPPSDSCVLIHFALEAETVMFRLVWSEVLR